MSNRRNRERPRDPTEPDDASASFDSQEQPAQLNNAARGRRSYEAGHSFEERVTELYRLLHYDVEHGRIFAGRQVDLFLTGRFGDLTVYRAIECKIGPVKAEHIDSFIAKLRLVRVEYPSAQGTMVSAASFTDAIKSQAAREGIQLTLYRDLAAQLLDGHAYVINLMRECKANEHYPMSLYIEPSIGYDVSGQSYPAFATITRWLRDTQSNQLTLLGDVGTGKSFLSRMIAYRLAVKFLARPLESPLPILIDLRNADRQFSLEGLVLTHLTQNGLERVSFEAFQYALSQGNVVLILDGFDEMAARVTPQVTNRNFHELARSVSGQAKVLLTCRTHYFKSRTDEEEVVLGSSQDYGSETARDLYWELIARKGFKIAYLRPFEILEIEKYVSRAMPKQAKQALRKIKHTYNLIELSQRPMLLEMIVKSIDKLNVAEINPATLYTVYTDAWVHRDQWRDILSPTAKLSFLMGLANSLWQEDTLTVHHARLMEHVQHELAGQIQNPQQLLEIDSEIRTASFLVRDDVGNYGFGHKSYGEFFLARYLASQLMSGNTDCLNIRRLSPEIIGFMKYMVDPSLEPLLERVLSESYRRLISENALMCLYGFRRDAYFNSQESVDDSTAQLLVVSLPVRMALAGAQLDQVTLEGAVLDQADLTSANLTQAILARADLSRADLSGAHLEKADLTQAVFESATLEAASLVGANLERANLSTANLRGADLSDAYLFNVVYEGADFEDVKLTRAVLPNDLRTKLGRRPDLESVRDLSLIQSNDLTIDEYWAFISDLRPLVMRFAAGMSLAAGIDPEDVAQEVIIKLLTQRNLERLRELDKEKRRQFIYVFTRNFITDYRRWARREVRFTDLDDDPGIRSFINRLPSPEMDPLEELVDSESHEWEKIALVEIEHILSNQSWRIIKARYLEGKSVKEIAVSEQLSVRTIQRYITKALEIVRGHFAPSNA